MTYKRSFEIGKLSCFFEWNEDTDKVNCWLNFKDDMNFSSKLKIWFKNYNQFSIFVRFLLDTDMYFYRSMVDRLLQKKEQNEN